MNAASAMRVDLAGWPAIAIQLNARGEIEASNGCLERLVGAPVVGRVMVDFLDDGPTLEKWRAAVSDPSPSSTLELVFRANDVPIAPRAFSLLRVDDEFSLVEHPVHPRLAQLAADVEATNTDLATAQRALVIERARLAAALTELERSNQALDEFAHAVSHDLKAPLRAMKDAGEVLVDPLTTQEERARYAGRVIELVGRMRRMIDGVFEYARAGRSRAGEDMIDTARTMNDLVAYLNPPPTVHVVVNPALPPIVGAHAPFEQVFRNLLSNAFTYRRGDGARVEVTGSLQGDFAEIAVSDNGPGIPAAQQSRIWGLFQTSRPGEGTGIGLAVVKRLVEAQGGSIELVSTPEVGSTFRVRWPARPQLPRGSSSAAS